MNILAWFNPTRWLILVLAAAILVAVLGYGHRQYSKGYKIATVEANTKIDRQKLDASAVLMKETTRANTAEHALQDFKNTQELKDVDHTKTVTGLSDQLRRAAGVAIRLRDPNAAPGCRLGGGGPTSPSAAPTGASADNRAEASGLLSTDLTELLQRLTREADEVNNAFASCKPYASKVSENTAQTKE